jgi:molybdate transport system ATP-binding protein
VTRPLRGFTLDVDLEVEGTVAVIGPSGAGKSTLLRLIAGLARPSSGLVECDGERWYGQGSHVPPERRRVGFVFQHYALFPHLSARANVAFGSEGRDVDPLLERLGISHLADARPATLSGGERQRVAVARALARRPRLLLLDEPLSALDPATRGAVAAELAAVLRDTGLPALVVTHAFDEAASLAERVLVMEHGRIVQDGAAADLLSAPASAFVAEFAGMNRLPGTASGTAVRLEDGREVRVADAADGPVAVLVAPWEVTLSTDPPHGDSALNHLRGTVRRVVPLGNRVRVSLDGLTAEVTPESAARLELRAGPEIVATGTATAARTVPRA